ncbi:hypothetical protein [Flaviaesturariibacter amylovorans]|uniref:Uncharacterized protein n=1 Tax=Flaviaesturariibacter amylovorans TaxID=1084520 RepID=A0ABP8GXC8_9BACT
MLISYMTDLLATRVNEVAFFVSLGVSAWFYQQFRKLEVQMRHEELLDGLLRKA